MHVCDLIRCAPRNIVRHEQRNRLALRKEVSSRLWLPARIRLVGSPAEQMTECIAKSMVVHIPKSPPRDLQLATLHTYKELVHRALGPLSLLFLRDRHNDKLGGGKAH